MPEHTFLCKPSFCKCLLRCWEQFAFREALCLACDLNPGSWSYFLFPLLLYFSSASWLVTHSVASSFDVLWNGYPCTPEYAQYFAVTMWELWCHSKIICSFFQSMHIWWAPDMSWYSESLIQKTDPWPQGACGREMKHTHTYTPRVGGWLVPLPKDMFPWMHECDFIWNNDFCRCN